MRLLTTEANRLWQDHPWIGNKSRTAGSAMLAGTDETAATPHSVEISPLGHFKRRAASSPGLRAEIVRITRPSQAVIRFQAPVHMLIAHDHGVRRSGETLLEGVPQSTLKELKRKLTFVPAGCKYIEYYDPKILPRITYIYLHPSRIPDCRRDGQPALAPRLFFEDSIIWGTVCKLSSLVESSEAVDQVYLESIGAVLVHELMRFNAGVPSPGTSQRGGLASWQQRVVLDYIEQHLAEAPQLAALAPLVRLSPHHLCRAFKQSLGHPPCRYHGLRRIERAKQLLADATFTVTEIALTLGYGETSSFTAAFRRTTGLTPTDYRRSLA